MRIELFNGSTLKYLFLFPWIFVLEENVIFFNGAAQTFTKVASEETIKKRFFNACCAFKNKNKFIYLKVIQILQFLIPFSTSHGTDMIFAAVNILLASSGCSHK